MSIKTSGPITEILGEIALGNESARNRLVKVAYDELHRLAGTFMRNERNGHTLQPTALVHETVLKLFHEHALTNVPNRACFFWAASRAMRQILVDQSRRRDRLCRGGEYHRVPLDSVIDHVEQEQGIDLLALNEALDLLEVHNKRHFEIVMLRFFVGLTIEEIAEQLDMSAATVKRDWRYARVWLGRRLSGDI